MSTLKQRQKQAFKRAIKVHGKKYDYSKVAFKSQHEKVTIICPQHGEWQQRFHSHLAGYGCPKCGVERQATSKAFSANELRKKFIQEAEKVHGKYYDYSKVSYVGKRARDKVTIIDPKLGEFEQTFGNHVTLKHKHPEHHLTVGKIEYIASIYGTVKERLEEFKRAVRKHHKGEYTYPYLKKEFKGFSSNITVVCKKCGPIVQTAHNHMKGHGCKYCARSYLEKKICRWLSKLVDTPVILNNRTIINGQELDIYLPEHKLAIEIGGVYWHSYPKVAKDYHVKKHITCEGQGISLITMFDSDWNIKEKRLVIKSRIRAKLGLFTQRIGARQCDIRVVKASKARKFLDTNHLQGFSTAKVYVGLYYENKLVSLLTLGKPRFNKNYSWEIIRFCNKKNLAVSGSFSKLFSWFVKEYNPDNVVTYSDLRWGKGSVYTTAGFTWIRNTQPAAWYTHVDGKRPLLHRTHMQKHKLADIFKIFDPKLTAEQNIVNNYYVPVYDCGAAVYEWRRT